MKKVFRILFALVFLLAACTPLATPDQEALAAGPITLPGGESELVCADGMTPDLSIVGGKITVLCVADDPPTEAPTETAVVVPTATEVPPTQTAVVPTHTLAPPATETAEMAATLTQTALPPTVTRTPTRTATAPPGGFAPWKDAPACVDTSGDGHMEVTDAKDSAGNSLYGLLPDRNLWHDLWNEISNCHYDHEHGQSAFTPTVKAAFPGFDFQVLQGGFQIGHLNPSSPAENGPKHGGFKIQYNLAVPNNGCTKVFEGGTLGISKYVIQFHEFGVQSIEHEARNHSSTALFATCKIGGDPNDLGYVYVAQLQEFGQRVMPYQGYLLPYPDNPTQSPWAVERGPYNTNECFGPDIPMPVGMSDLGILLADCRTSLAGHVSSNGNVNSKWSSKISGSGPRPEVPRQNGMLFNVRDGYQGVDSADFLQDNDHPFRWLYLCSTDGGVTFNAAMPKCRWNNSTATISEWKGEIPAAWDNLAGVDSDSRVGRVTGQFFLTQFGVRRQTCTVAYPAIYTMTIDGMVVTDPGCYPIKLVSAWVGVYSSELQAIKTSNPTPANTPERDIYFCPQGSSFVVCPEYQLTNPNQINGAAIPSGWIGGNN